MTYATSDGLTAADSSAFVRHLARPAPPGAGVVMWCASHVKTIVDKVQELKDTQGGSYQGLELLGVEDALETKVATDDKAAGVGAAIGPLAEDIIPQEEQKIGELL